MSHQLNQLSNPLDVLHVSSKKVMCDGSRDSTNQSSGHPAIYLNMGQNSSISCPYCSKSFSIEQHIANLRRRKEIKNYYDNLQKNG